MRKVIVSMIILLFVFNVSLAFSASLWPKDKKDTLFSDNKARNIGDIITILITENSSTSQSVNRKIGKKTSVQGGAGTGVLDFIPIWGLNTSTTLKGGGSVTSNEVITARITAKIVGVLPNGNLKIEGIRRVVINNDSLEIIITGVIRPEDIKSDNTILSTYISDAQISYRGTGSLTNAQKEGILSQILNWLF